MDAHEQLRTQGYVVLEKAIPEDWLKALRARFDEGVIASDQWPVPRDRTWRFSSVDLDAQVQAVCRLPALIAAVGGLMGERFFLAQVEGREPLPGFGHQTLHRDAHVESPGDAVHAMVFFDDYGPANGATRVVPRTHSPAADEPEFDFLDESRTLQLSGKAGDILVFGVDLVHGGSCNLSGARRRSLLVSYFAEGVHALHQQTAALRHVRMDTSERFDRVSA